MCVLDQTQGGDGRWIGRKGRSMLASFMLLTLAVKVSISSCHIEIEKKRFIEL
jgi:hypothetical protein